MRDNVACLLTVYWMKYWKNDWHLENSQYVVQLLSCVWPPWSAAHQASLSFSISWSLRELMSIETMKLSNHLILCCPFSSCLSFLASGSFPKSWLLTSGGQSIGASASVSFLPMNIQGWFPLGLTGLISWLSKGLSRDFSSTTVGKHQFLGAQSFFSVNSSNSY